MTLPGFSADISLDHRSGHYRNRWFASALSDPLGQVVPAIPPCKACDHILDLCFAGRLRGAICYYCAVGYCDPIDWNDPSPMDFR
jgi:hypothetical protein